MTNEQIKLKIAQYIELLKDQHKYNPPLFEDDDYIIEAGNGKTLNYDKRGDLKLTKCAWPICFSSSDVGRFVNEEFKNKKGVKIKLKAVLAKEWFERRLGWLRGVLWLKENNVLCG